ncbi:hypothetical protein D9M72_371160 [compost metagenome]
MAARGTGITVVGKACIVPKRSPWLQGKPPFSAIRHFLLQSMGHKGFILRRDNAGSATCADDAPLPGCPAGPGWPCRPGLGPARCRASNRTQRNYSEESSPCNDGSSGCVGRIRGGVGPVRVERYALRHRRCRCRSDQPRAGQQRRPGYGNAPELWQLVRLALGPARHRRLGRRPEGYLRAGERVRHRYRHLRPGQPPVRPPGLRRPAGRLGRGHAGPPAEFAVRPVRRLRPDGRGPALLAEQR